jgi:cytochrome P450
MTEHKLNLAPGPCGVSALRAYFVMRKNRLSFITNMQRNFGNVSCLRIAGRSLFIVASASAAREVLSSRLTSYRKGPGIAEAEVFFGDGLLTAEGPEWTRQRKAVGNFLSTVEPDSIIETVRIFFEEVCRDWKSERPEAVAQNVTAAIAKIVCGVMCRRILGDELDAIELRQELAIVENHAMRKTVAMFPRLMRTSSTLSSTLQLLDKRAQRVADGKPESLRIDEDSLFHYLRNQPENGLHKELVDQARTFFLAGQDNVVAAVLWSIVLMSSRRSLQERVHNEILTVCGEEPLRNFHFRRLNITRSVLMEAMRLYPPVWAITRRATEDTEIGGYYVPKGSDIVVSPYLMHRDSSIWPDANEFVPERFIGGDAAGRGRMFVPFGYGPRTCVAREFGLTEALAILTFFFGKYSAVTFEEEELKPTVGFSLRPNRDVYLSITALH